MTVNSWPIPTPEGGRIVVINAGLIGLLHSFNEMVISLRKYWPSFSNDLPLNDLNQDELNEYIRDNVEYYLLGSESKSSIAFDIIEGTNSGVQRYVNSRHLQFLSLSQQIFILAHELAHFIKGHPLDMDTLKTQVPNFTSNEYEMFLYSQKNEREADELGLEIALGCIKDYRRKLVGWHPVMKSWFKKLAPAGLHLLFFYLDVAEKILEAKGHRQYTHPPAYSRYEYIKKHVKIPSNELNWHILIPCFEIIFKKSIPS